MLTRQSTICGKYHGNTGYLLRNVDVGIEEYAGTGYHVDDRQMAWTDELQMMKSCGSHTSQSHKQIAQQITQNKMTSHPRMEMTNDAFQMLQSNSGAYGVPETG